VGQLADADREILLLRHAEELPFDEISCLLDITPATARKRFGRALIRLQTALTDAEPPTAHQLSAGRRYNAACAAAMAGSGQGKDADQLDARERAKLRKQAFDRLRGDMAALRNLLETDKSGATTFVLQRTQQCLRDVDFAGVRGAEALAKLPEPERGDWQRLWDDVADLRQRAQPIKR
jgi:hypothetical protein